MHGARLGRLVLFPGEHTLALSGAAAEDAPQKHYFFSPAHPE